MGKGSLFHGRMYESKDEFIAVINRLLINDTRVSFVLRATGPLKLLKPFILNRVYILPLRVAKVEAMFSITRLVKIG